MKNHDAHFFQKNGYAIVPNILAAAEARYYQVLLHKLAAADKATGSFQWTMKNGVMRTPDLWPLITHWKLRERVQHLLGVDELRYAGNSALKVWHRRKASGWHRDSVGKEFGRGSEWDEGHDKYKVVRVAFYLQPYAHQFCWGGIPGSHLYERTMSQSACRVWRQLLPAPKVSVGSRLPYLANDRGRLWISTKARINRLAPPARPVWIRTRPTDCVIFDPRLIHVGGNVDQWKYAILLSFGANNAHTRTYLAHHAPRVQDGVFEGTPQLLEERLRTAQLWMN